jgi:hypothetical protein
VALAFILQGQPLRDLWWTKRHWDKSFSEYFIIVPPVLTLIIICWHSYRKEKRMKAGKLKNITMIFRKSENCVWKTYYKLCMNGFSSMQTCYEMHKFFKWNILSITNNKLNWLNLSHFKKTWASSSLLHTSSPLQFIVKFTVFSYSTSSPLRTEFHAICKVGLAIITAKLVFL